VTTPWPTLFWDWNRLSTLLFYVKWCAYARCGYISSYVDAVWWMENL